MNFLSTPFLYFDVPPTYSRKIHHVICDAVVVRYYFFLRLTRRTNIFILCSGSDDRQNRLAAFLCLYTIPRTFNATSGSLMAFNRNFVA